MRTFATYIEYLLMTRHYCYVPGRGAYMLVDENASQGVTPSIGADSRKLHDMKAPCRTVVFSSLHTHDDGLLANLLMEAEGMTYDEACRYIERQAPLLPDSFTESASLHTDTENFGFESLSVETWFDIEERIKRSTAEPDVAVEAPAVVAAGDDDIRIPRYWVKRAAVAILIVALFFSNFIHLNDQSTQMASVIDINAIQRALLVHQTWNEEDEFADLGIVNDEEVVDVKNELISEPVNSISSANEVVKPVIEEKKAAAPSKTQTEQSTKPNTFYIIIASTTSEKEAKRVVIRYREQGFDNVGILERDGLYRLYLDMFYERQTALSYLREVRKGGDRLSKAWLLPITEQSLSYIIKDIYNDNQLSMELSHPKQRTERDQG